MSEKIVGSIHTKIRFEALIRNHKTGDIEMKDVFVQYQSSVIYEAGGEEKVVVQNEGITDHDHWTAAIARTQPLTTYGQTGELISLRKKEMEIEKRMNADRQRTIFDVIEDTRDKLTDELHAEASERYDNMIR